MVGLGFQPGLEASLNAGPRNKKLASQVFRGGSAFHDLKGVFLSLLLSMLVFYVNMDFVL